MRALTHGKSLRHYYCSLSPVSPLSHWRNGDQQMLIAQSITTGANLPFKHNHLNKYCPQHRNKTHLVNQWLITSQSTFYKIKNNGCVSEHLAKYRIFMNLTNVKAKRSHVL
eukprot:3049883-Ditylum_brightwellii.AAC.1